MRHYQGYTPYLLVILLLLPAILFVHKHTVSAVPLNKPFDSFPLTISSWTKIKNFTFTNDIISLLQPTDYLSRQYIDRDNKIADLYIAYYDGGYNRVGIHSPLYCMPGNGWNETYKGIKTIVINNQTINYCELIFEKDGAHEYMIYWYQIGNYTTPSQYLLKVYTALNSVFLNRRDQSLIRVTVNAQNGIEQARNVAWQFVMDVQPALSSYIPN